MAGVKTVISKQKETKIINMGVGSSVTVISSGNNPHKTDTFFTSNFTRSGGSIEEGCCAKRLCTERSISEQPIVSQEKD